MFDGRIFLLKFIKKQEEKRFDDFFLFTCEKVLKLVSKCVKNFINFEKDIINIV